MYVSCWTDEAEESIAMWQMYTPNMHGIRIQLPAFPFKKHFYKAGEFHFQTDTLSYIDFKKLYEDDRASIVAELPKLIPVTCTKDETLLKPVVRFGDTISDCENVVNSKNNGNQSSSVRFDLSNLGKFKKDVWWFQKEWRYWITMSSFGMKELEVVTTKSYIELARRLEDEKAIPPLSAFLC